MMSSLHRVMAGSAAGIVVAVGSLGVSTPASAVDYVHNACQSSGYVIPGLGDSTVYVLNADDTLTVTYEHLSVELLSPGVGCNLATIQATGVNGTVSLTGTEITVALTDPSAAIFLGAGTHNGAAYTGFFFTFALRCGSQEILNFSFDLPLLGSCRDANTPADVTQQTTPLTDSCDIIDSDYNWSGVESGGWGSSWAQWPNDNTGGVVCTRTLRYTLETGRWSVAK
jgi:hypothetical protein